MHAAPARQPPIRSWVPYWVLALSLLLTGVATYRVASTSNHRDKLRFENLAQKIQTLVDNRMDTYIALVRAPSGLFALDQPISRREFQAFVQQIELRQHYPGIQGIGFTRRMLPSEQETVIATMRRQEGQEGFRIWPDFPRAEIHSTLYLEPMDRRNRAAVGFDMFTEPVRRAAMERARDTGLPAATGRVTLVQEIDPQKQAGFLVYVPVYRGGPLRTLEERRAALEGFVYSPFRAGDLFHGILDTEKNPMVSFQIYAGSKPSPEALLYRSHPEAATGARARFHTSRTIDFAGTPWTISYSTLPDFDAISGRDRAYQILALGLLTSGILFAVTRSQARARAEAETANQAKDQFMAALSHELRTPLSPVLAVIAGLEAEGQLSAGVRDRLAVIRRNVELEARLIDDLLDLTRITRGKLELKPEVTDLRQVVEEALEACCPQGASERPRFLFEMPEMDYRIWGDAPRLTQVFWNLFKNALKFTPDGGPIRVRARCEEPAAELAVEVVDPGIGIEPERLTQIFDAFEQGHRKITRQFGGLGLGLAISKAIVDLHGGRLTASSDGPGQGSTFTVHLPIGAAQDHAASAPLAATPESAAALSDRPLHILLVEDHPDTADAMATLLSVLGHEVTVAHDADAALAAAEAAHSDGGVDLVLSDVGLPGVSGLELMVELKRRYQYRGIALSGYGMDEDVQRSREAGFERHLTKPVNIEILKEAIREVAEAT